MQDNGQDNFTLAYGTVKCGTGDEAKNQPAAYDLAVGLASLTVQSKSYAVKVVMFEGTLTATSDASDKLPWKLAGQGLMRARRGVGIPSIPVVRRCRLTSD